MCRYIYFHFWLAFDIFLQSFREPTGGTHVTQVKGQAVSLWSQSLQAKDALINIHITSFHEKKSDIKLDWSFWLNGKKDESSKAGVMRDFHLASGQGMYF